MTTKDRRLKYKNEETPGPGTYEVSTSLLFSQVSLSFCKFTIWNFHYCVMFVLQHYFMTVQLVLFCSGGSWGLGVNERCHATPQPLVL